MNSWFFLFLSKDNLKRFFYRRIEHTSTLELNHAINNTIHNNLAYLCLMQTKTFWA